MKKESVLAERNGIIMSLQGFDHADARKAIEKGAVEWQRHVLERIVERGIRRSDVLNVVLTGERIEDYPTDFPYPSALFLGWVGSRPLHVVAAYDAVNAKVYMITAYEPDQKHFENDYKKRKQS